MIIKNGTDKQIVYANDIKNDLFAALADVAVLPQKTTGVANNMIKSMPDQIGKKYGDVSNAKTWIDNRDELESLIMRAFKGLVDIAEYRKIKPIEERNIYKYDFCRKSMKMYVDR